MCLLLLCERPVPVLWLNNLELSLLKKRAHPGALNMVSAHNLLTVCIDLDPHIMMMRPPPRHDEKSLHNTADPNIGSDSEVEMFDVDVGLESGAGHVSRTRPFNGDRNRVQNAPYVEYDKNLMVYITCPTLNFAHINLVDLNKLIGSLDGNFKDCRVTRNAKLRLVCETSGQHAKLLRTNKIGNRKVTVESAITRAPNNFCLIYGVSTDMTVVEIKDLLDVTPDLIFRVKRGGETPPQ